MTTTSTTTLSTSAASSVDSDAVTVSLLPLAPPVTIDVMDIKPFVESLGRQTWKERATAQLQEAMTEEEHLRLTHWLVAGLTATASFLITTVVAAIACRCKRCDNCCLMRALRFLRRQPSSADAELPFSLDDNYDLELRRLNTNYNDGVFIIEVLLSRTQLQ